MLVAAVVVYFAVNVGEVYWRFYQFRDDMRQEVRFASKNTDAQIVTSLRADADSLGLPDDASDISVQRGAGDISIDAEYDERVELPMYARLVHFHPHAEGSP
jgi:hypothetical protein